VNMPAAQLAARRKPTRQKSFSSGHGKNRPAVAQSTTTTIDSTAERIVEPCNRERHVHCKRLGLQWNRQALSLQRRFSIDIFLDALYSAFK
jgi:hypothetical protein